MSSVRKAAKPLNIIVLGPTGLAGSAISIELLNRGHHVTGMSRNPEKLGKHPLYSTKKVDLSKVQPDDLMELLKGVDVVIEYTHFPFNSLQY
jgi:putative NADH-flavin reductase